MASARPFLHSLILAAATLVALPVEGAAPAVDNTGYAPPYYAGGYWAGWENGMNGGYGFLPWQQTVTSDDFRQNDFSVNYAFGNGGQGDPFPHSIDVFIGSWNLSAKDGNTAAAIRPFTPGGINGSAILGVGQQLKVSMDNGYVNELGGVVGFGLQNAAGENRLEFYFVGGQANYKMNIGGTELDTGIPWTQRGLNFTFTQLAPTGAFSLLVDPLDGGEYLLPGIALAADISQIRLFNFNSDPIGLETYNNQYPTPSYQLYFNRLEILDAPVPEPGTAGLLLAGSLGLFAALRRKRTSV